MSTLSYPARVSATLDPGMSRWMWLLKWLLLVPHYVVLLGLWMAFLVLSVVAFFAILATGRYPRAIFDFNVGVLRWSWRVSYYAYGALGTDRYPPFTLADVPDYPAHFDVDYPERLSRGLALIKWWLLAIPHLLIVGLLVGGVGFVATGSNSGRLVATGLIGLLALVAGFALLFTGRYPRPLFDLLLGLNRWVLRVAAYVALMTDTYPPFRLDQGGDEGPESRAPAALGPPGPAAGTARRRTGWTAGRIATMAVTGLLVPMWLGLVGGGVVLAVADLQLRDELGYLMSPDAKLSTPTYAITSEELAVHIDGPGQALADALIGDVQVTVDAGAKPVFVGIAPSAKVTAYLDGAAHATVIDYADRATYEVSGSGAPTGAPAAEDIWVAQAQGVGQQGIVWQPEDGDWTLVLMNADGSAGVDATAAMGAEVPALGTVVAVLLSVGGTALVLSLVVLVLTVRAAGRP